MREVTVAYLKEPIVIDFPRVTVSTLSHEKLGINTEMLLTDSGLLVKRGNVHSMVPMSNIKIMVLKNEEIRKTDDSNKSGSKSK